MEEHAERRRRGPILVRLGLAGFVLAWLLGPPGLRAAVPALLVFLLALGLEAHFFLDARRAAPPARRVRGPQAVDRERYGDAGEFLLLKEDGEQLWIPYAGETGEELDELIAEARTRREEEADAAEPAAPVPERGRPLRRLASGVGVIGAVALVLWLAEGRTGWTGLDPDTRARAETLFSAEASRIAGKPVEIRCDEAGDHVGIVQHADGAAVVGGDVAYLTPERCHDLYRLAYHGEEKGSQTARSLAVLAHEAWHLRGVRDEGTTECYALQSAVELGRRLGLAEDEARRMMRQRLAENVLHRRGSPEYLLPAECRAGGRLDLNPGRTLFP